MNVGPKSRVAQHATRDTPSQAPAVTGTASAGFKRLQSLAGEAAL